MYIDRFEIFFSILLLDKDLAGTVVWSTDLNDFNNRFE